MLREAQFLDYKPSLCAAAALMAAINIAQSPLARSLGIRHISDKQMKKFLNREVKVPQEALDQCKSLSLWHTEISRLTSINKEEIEPVYKALISSLNEHCYKNQLSWDADFDV